MNDRKMNDEDDAAGRKEKEQETHGGCQVNGPKVAKFLGR